VARPASSAPKQIHELFDRETSVRDDVAECARPNLPVVRDDDTRMRYIPSQDHVTARLPSESEARTFQGRADLSPRQVCRQLRHEVRARLGRVDFDEFPAGLDRNRFTGVDAIIHV
jgi:hypothetical protein